MHRHAPQGSSPKVHAVLLEVLCHVPRGRYYLRQLCATNRDDDECEAVSPFISNEARAIESLCRPRDAVPTGDWAILWGCGVQGVNLVIDSPFQAPRGSRY